MKIEIITIIVSLFAIILVVLSIGKNNNEVPTNTYYKVYYKYDIYNNDTIPVDTIYVPINQ